MKIIKKKTHSEKDEKEIRNEINILKTMDHPNIVKILNFIQIKTHIILLWNIVKEENLFQK